MIAFSFSLDELKTIADCSHIEGPGEGTITGIASLEMAGPDDLSFLGNSKYKHLLGQSKAKAILVPEDYSGAPGEGQAFLRVSDPSLALTLICETIEQQNRQGPPAGIHPTAVVDPSAEVHPKASIGPLCVVEAHARIGSGTQLQAQVFIGQGAQIGQDCQLAPQAVVAADCLVGDRVQIYSGAVIGSDGFGYATVAGQHHKVPQIGHVVLEDEVEIGANTTIDRARFHETRVSRGTKIDNLVQIGHNVSIGANSIIVAQVGIAGSTVLEESVTVGGQAGIGGHITIGKHSQIAGQSGIDHNLAPGSVMRGTPGHPISLQNRILVLQKRLPDLFKRLKRLEEMIPDPAVESH